MCRLLTGLRTDLHTRTIFFGVLGLFYYFLGDTSVFFQILFLSGLGVLLPKNLIQSLMNRTSIFRISSSKNLIDLWLKSCLLNFLLV